MGTLSSISWSRLRTYSQLKNASDNAIKPEINRSIIVYFPIRWRRQVLGNRSLELRRASHQAGVAEEVRQAAREGFPRHGLQSALNGQGNSPGLLADDQDD